MVDAQSAYPALMPWSDPGRLSVVAGTASEGGARPARLDRLPRSPGSAEASASTPRHYETSLSLLEHAARALEILYERRDQLEASLEEVSSQAEAAVVAAHAKVMDWQNLASSLKTDKQDLERRLAAMQHRAESAEARLDAERSRADAAERQVSEALGQSEGLQSKIISAFGLGSNAHKALLVAVDQGRLR
ncbi:MAG: hypothetical protein ACRYGP_14825 [Janthinobacterium lividum]